MSTTVDPISTYDEWLAARGAHEANYDLRAAAGFYDDIDAARAILADGEALNDRLYHQPGSDLFRALWLVDNWERSTVPPESDDEGGSTGILFNEQRNDWVTTAQDVRWLVELLVAELRRLRPELAPSV